MSEETKNTGAVATEDKPKTEPELMAEMDAAVKSGDYKAVAKVAQALVKFQKEKEDAERQVIEKARTERTERVKAAIGKVLQPMVDKGELDEDDGIWYQWDFGEKLVACRLTKSAPRKSSGGGGGGGKKFSVSTNDLLAQFGDEEYKDGMTFRQAHDSNTDKNWRYAIREALLKKGGYIS